MDRRAFLMAAMANGALAAAPAAFAAPVLDGQATRTAAGGLQLDWNAKAEPTSIFVSSDPDAQQPYMRAVKTALRGGKAELPLPVSPRPYLLLTAPGGRQVRVAERLLPLQGGRNFRDLGGYRASDGRQVRWGRIYRSGVMSGLTAADMGYLSGLGIEVICDLRSNQERKTEPNPFLKTEAPQVIATDYDMPAMAGMQGATTRASAIDYTDGQYTSTTDPTLSDSAFIVNGRLALSDIRLADGGADLQVSLWSRNLFDEKHAFLKNFNAALGTYGIYNEPRTFGVEANIKY